MTTARIYHTATLLSDGRVLVAGGGDGQGSAFAESELYDPKTGTFSATAEMTTPRSGQTATLLPDGRVLVAGGKDASMGNVSLASAELYDAKTGTFTPTGAMATPRIFHTATLLSDGRVLMAGGANGSAELYDPKTGTFTPTGALATPRTFHTATLLSDGRVLMAGGTSTMPSAEQIVPPAEVYDPKTGTFSLTGSMTTERRFHTATLLRDGRVLIAGGVVASAELYDPKSGTFTPTGSLTVARSSSTATLLPDGGVLIVGGSDHSQNILASAELYVFGPGPTSGTESSAPSTMSQTFNPGDLASSHPRVLEEFTYKLTGTALSANIAYTDDHGSVQQKSNVVIPMHNSDGTEGIAIWAWSGQPLSITAQKTHPVTGGDLTCEIWDDGMAVGSAGMLASDHGVSSVSCSATAP
jgi:prolyl-tRNA editing enzyme YbaK/EbsC (Cys-tRNA(Pro) deacylase)